MTRIPKCLLPLTLVATLAGCGGGVVVGLDLGYVDVYYEDVQYENQDRPPAVSLAVNPSVARVGEVVQLVAAATDDRGVRSVSFFEVDADGVSRGLVTLGGPPYTIDTFVPSTSRGVIYYMARATDTSGQYRDSRLSSVTVLP